MVGAMQVADQLTKWRHLIEGETGGGLTPVPWDEVLRMPLIVLEGRQSVLVLRDVPLGGRMVRSIWVAAGDLNEVLRLVAQAEDRARREGIPAMVFMGRRGWVRAAPGYHEQAIVGLKEL